jgi:hypothetical protein
MKRVLLVVPIVVLACTVTRPTHVPAPSASEHRRTYPALLVTDSSGRTRWVYDAWVERDTLRGLRFRETRERIVVPINQVVAVAEPRFSAGRTAGLLGGLAGVAVVVVLLFPDPVVEYDGLAQSGSVGTGP